MKVKKVIEILSNANQEAEVHIRYNQFVALSDITSGEEIRIGDLVEEAVIIPESEERAVVFAADLCDCY